MSEISETPIPDSSSKFKRKAYVMGILFVLAFGLGTFVYLRFFTQEAQNRMSRTLQNWTGVDGTLDIYADGKLVKRFIEIDKFSTAKGTEDGAVRPYRYAWGVWDKNLNHQKDEGENVVYFEVSVHSTYVFYQEGR